MNHKLNVLLITSDQQHWTMLGTLNPNIKTPNLDRLAARGTLFNRAYCRNPTCTPTRASIITGMYPSQHGAYSLGTKLMENVHTVGEDFRAAGSDAALIGEAHFRQLRATEEFPRWSRIDPAGPGVLARFFGAVLRIQPRRTHS